MERNSEKEEKEKIKLYALFFYIKALGKQENKKIINRRLGIIMLKFIGIGSAFNSELGNNGAFIKSPNGKTLFLIDCGETTFYRLEKYGVLEGVENVFVLITHFHPDNVGSLGTLIYKTYYKFPFKARTTVITPEVKTLKDYFVIIGIRNEHCFIRALEGSYKRDFVDLRDEIGRLIITPVLVSHDKVIKCYGYYIESIDLYKGKRIYYSGDACEIPKQVIDDLKSGNIDTLYQDVSTHDYEDNIHLSLKKLDELINPECRDRVYCMHIDKDWDNKVASSLGFKTVDVFYK